MIVAAMTTSARLAVILVCGHLLADFVSQSKRSAALKTNALVLTLHALIAALIPYLLVGSWTFWQLAAVTFITHWVIDFIKVKSNKNGLASFAIDQIAHLLVIYAFIQLTSITPSTLRWSAHFGDAYMKVLIVVAGSVAVTVVSGIVVGYVVRDVARLAPVAKDTGFPSGGERIGQLERFLVYVLILIGEPNAIGFLIAAKSILRFGELKEDRRDAEYVIIGTMWSLVCALLVSLAVRTLIY
jgi:hypothetical protein